MLLEDRVGPALLVAPLLAVAAVAVVSYVRTSARGRIGATTEVAALATFLLGALAGAGQLVVAGAAGVALAVLLVGKPRLEAFSNALTTEEIMAALELAVITVIVLPLLPDRGYGPWQVLNPRRIRGAGVLGSARSFVGFVALRGLGPGRGMAITGAVGGLVSSTAITISMAERSHAGAVRAAAASAAVLASTIMCVRMAALAGAVDPGILPRLLPILTVMAVAGGAAAWLMGRGTAGRTPAVDGTLTNPFSLKAALTFAALYTLVLLGVRAAEEHLGAGGLYLASALSAIVRVDAPTVALARLGAGPTGWAAGAVARAPARRGRSAAAVDAQRLGARILREPEPPRRAARERPVLARDAEVAPAHVAGGHELPEHPLRGVDRDAEAQALRAQDHGRVDADHAPAAVDQRPARVARVERDVALDDALHQPPRGGAHGAPERAHHARRHGRAEAERVADRDHELPDAEPARAAELGVGKSAPVDREDREIGGLVGADERRRERAAVGQGDADALRAAHDVGVGEEIAVGREKDARAGAGGRAPFPPCRHRDARHRRTDPLDDRHHRLGVGVEQLRVGGPGRRRRRPWSARYVVHGTDAEPGGHACDSKHALPAGQFFAARGTL